MECDILSILGFACDVVGVYCARLPQKRASLPFPLPTSSTDAMSFKFSLQYVANRDGVVGIAFCWYTFVQ